MNKTGRGRIWDKWLHAAYFRSAGMNFFIARRIRPTGIALCLVLLLCTFLIAQKKEHIYLIFSLVFGMGLIGVPWAFSRRARLEARRELPRHATAGEPLSYSVRVKNIGKSRVSRAWISDSPPDPRPERWEFIDQREPGEEERNVFDRTLAYYRWQWIMARKRAFDGLVSSVPLNLKPGEESRITMELTPLHRGVVLLNDSRVLLPDPFGCFQRCRKIKAPSSVLTVLPRRYRLHPVEMPGDAAFKIGGEANTNTIGSAGEFLGLRDYRPGDPLRQIHWKSWARTGRPIVKEVEDTHYPRYGLILDTFSSNGADAVFEDLVSVAASFAATIDTSESLLDLMFIKDRAHLVTAGRGLARADKLLEVLAGVTAERVTDFIPLARLVLRHRDELTSCLVILNGWDEARSAFLGSLRAGGIICTPIVIGKGPAPHDIRGHWLESGEISRDLKRMPDKFSSFA